MDVKRPLPLRPRTPTLQPFPTRGVPGGWREAWDTDPLADLPTGRPPSDARRRSVCGASLRGELVAHAREGGRWVASVAHELPGPADGSGARPTAASSVAWRSVNGPTAAAALDVLEAEVRDAACGAQPDTETALPKREGR
jgi:hypothetical protein